MCVTSLGGGVSVCPRVYVAEGASKCARVAESLSVSRDWVAEGVCGSPAVSPSGGCSLWVWGSEEDLCGQVRVCQGEGLCLCQGVSLCAACIGVCVLVCQEGVSVCGGVGGVWVCACLSFRA